MEQPIIFTLAELSSVCVKTDGVEKKGVGDEQLI